MPDAKRLRLRRNTTSADIVPTRGATGSAGSGVAELEDAVPEGVNADAETHEEDSSNHKVAQQRLKRTRLGTDGSISAEAAAPAIDADVVDLCSSDSPDAAPQQEAQQLGSRRLQRQQQQQTQSEDGPQPFSHLWQQQQQLVATPQQQQHEPQAHPPPPAAVTPSARNTGQPIFYYPAPAELNKQGYTAFQFPQHKYNEHFRQTMLDMDRSTDRQWNPGGKVWLVLDQALDSALQHLQQNGFRPSRCIDSRNTKSWEEFCRAGSRRQSTAAAAAQQRSTPAAAAAAAGALALTPQGRSNQQRSGGGGRRRVYRGRQRSRIDADDEAGGHVIDLDKSEGDEDDEDDEDDEGE